MADPNGIGVSAAADLVSGGSQTSSLEREMFCATWSLRSAEGTRILFLLGALEHMQGCGSVPCSPRQTLPLVDGSTI